MKEDQPLEKDIPSKKDTNKSLKKDKSSNKVNKEDVQGKSLEKDKLSKELKAEDGQGKSLEKDKPSKEVKKEDGQGKSLEKGKSSKEVNKEEDRGKPLEKDKKPLEKDLLASSPSVEREQAKLRPAPHKPVVVVDWHETLEIDGEVPEENDEALQKLLEVAHVHILSYVESSSREGRGAGGGMAKLTGVTT
ncbi:unnamed protein product [Effrenium voratum]|nr:unnamed protein product [Effrenium voratum]